MQYAKNAASEFMQSLEDWLRHLDEKHELTPAAHEVVQAVINDPRHASFASAAELAMRANVNVATITRTAQSLGFSGWPDLRQEIRARFMSKLSAPEVSVVHQQETGSERPFDAALNRQIEQLTALRRRTDRQSVRDVAKTIADAKRRIVVGSGSFASIANILAHHATLCGYRTELATDGVMIANALGDVKEGDVVVIITFWRLYNSAIRAARQAKERGATTCIITDAAVDALAENGDHLLLAPAESTSFYTTILPGISLVEAISAELGALDPAMSARSIANFEEQWLSQDLLFTKTAPMAGKPFDKI
ncbi:MurR/RpiR family transcriptional regulator (plasmid) [Agrobacterium rosae]|uniref:MurR/RpiR family transcriptional regulator n=1 Tax=Agrobacterium rosae TaxID=1972867 RepID=A0AAE5RU18_9HYPH|nr:MULTISPECIES: MurR/RpiR family transcriptional regulator [Agrobacterium]KAA3507868.1 MurR/RpiR family transcriptional regulator [Agrobacterium rosae]KAA3512847.1 MurR/RpiR family transcriptional regulator [Agrobacterium rosae]MCM2436184.1 MurR/RpiR family transcriptional regulator [Agrobacterium rosae]MDX8305284.1 MurR/RpiR family transcriptional regulator [Agrobacterium rosae]MDX8331621.1 MurR/RpiR family transcriptional regulator [Agrobacterium rosae]